MVKRLILLSFLVSSLTNLMADEGLWLPLFLKQLNEKEMRNLGMKIKAEDIYNVNKGSLKDAVILFGSGCTGSLVSSDALLITNYHCGYSQIASHSSLEDNKLKNGFWAKTRKDEIRCSGLTVTFISRIDEVTDIVLKSVNANANEIERQSQIDKNIEALKISLKKEANEDVSIKSFFAGNQYFAFITKTYKDIRLVGAPPESLGKFGDDSDNWTWPNHTGDFALFRVYAGKDNQPADYDVNNIPFKPKSFLPISLNGVKEGDFTMVFGFPGRTDEYLPSVAVQHIAESIDPVRTEFRDKALKIMNSKMKKDPKIKIQYASKYRALANYWKKWIGERKGLLKTHAIDKKKVYETEFLKRINLNQSWKSSYGNILDEFGALYSVFDKYDAAKEANAEVFSRTIDIFKQANSAVQLANSYSENGQKAYEETSGKLLNGLSGFYKNYDVEIDREMFVELLMLYKEEVDKNLIPENIKNITPQTANDIFKSSVLIDENKWRDVLKLEPNEAIQIIKSDPIVKLINEVNDFNKTLIIPKVNELQTKINALQRLYMKAQMDVFNEKKFYPDANSTLRISYGKVKSYSPRDGVKYNYQTTIDGIMEKYIPGDYEYDLDNHFLDLYNKKEYGRYAQNGTLPVAFIGTNHTTGGNSGSPVIDAKGQLIALNFDRVWEGTMSDLNYDPDLCRNIMVDIRYILWIIDKYAGATYLINEMTINQK